MLFKENLSKQSTYGIHIGEKLYHIYRVLHFFVLNSPLLSISSLISHLSVSNMNVAACVDYLLTCSRPSLDLTRRLQSQSVNQVWLSQPTWRNHQPLKLSRSETGKRTGGASLSSFKSSAKVKCNLTENSLLSIIVPKLYKKGNKGNL